MHLRRTVFLLPILPILAACGGATLVLKSPVEDQCNKAGLQGCPDVVGGVLVYIDGDKPNGKDRMLRGAAQNAPEKVKAFAQAIKTLPLDKIPGAQKYTTIIVEIANILAGAPGAAAPPGAPAGPAGPPVAAQPGQAPPGVGYELFYNGRRVSGPDAQFYTLEQAVQHCTGIVAQKADAKVTCSFNGQPLTVTR
jgi:hypothetical protein